MSLGDEIALDKMYGVPMKKIGEAVKELKENLELQNKHLENVIFEEIDRIFGEDLI